MRDALSTMSSPSPSFSTSTLLKEITCLRAQLKELEDDTKSNISSIVVGDMVVGETETMNALRKELASVEHEKANLEKEFMNQLSSLAQDNRAVVFDLQNKLVQSEARNVSLQDQLEALGSSAGADGNTRRWMTILEQEKNRHNEEIEQMRATLQSSDMEIAECRRELDSMAEQLEDVHTEKDELLREVTDVRLQFSEQKRRNESLRTELKECNGSISKLRQEVVEKEDVILEKDHLIETKVQEMGEMNDTLIELESHKEMLLSEVGDLKQQLEKVKYRKKSKCFHDESISPTEKETLTTGVHMLEERLEIFQSKLTERDSIIEQLSTTLGEERQQNTRLKAQIKKFSNEADNFDGMSPVSPPKKLSQRPSSHPWIVTSSSQTSPSENSRLATPRTPVSSIVASFERRASRDSLDPTTDEDTIHNKDDDRLSLPILEDQLRKVKETNHCILSELSLAKDESSAFQERLHESLGEIKRLQTKLSESDRLKAAIDDLNHQLQLEKETIAQLRRELAVASLDQSETQDACMEVERLTSKLREYEALQLNHEQTIMELERELLDEKEKSHELHTRLDTSEEQYSKSLAELRDQLVKEQEQLQRMMLKVEKQELEHSKELKDIEQRLAHERALVSKLRSDLDATASNRPSPTSVELQLRESQREVERLTLEFTSLATSYDDLKKNSAELTKLQTKANSDSRQLETEISFKEHEVERLKHELSYTLSSGSSIQEEKKESHTEDRQGNSEMRSHIVSLQNELAAALAEIERLLDETEELRNALRHSQTGKTYSDEINLTPKDQMTYEMKLTKLHVELTQTQVAKKEMEADLGKRVEELEEELEALETEAEEELEKKEKELQVLLEDLQAKETKIAQLEVQQKQSRSSLNDNSTNRHDDMEELQAELISMTSKTSTQAREIQSLKLKLEEVEARKADLEKKLQNRITELEEEIVDVTRSARPQDADHLREENNKLRKALRDVRLERRLLQDRLDSLASDKCNSKSAQVLRERNGALKDEVEKLTKRLKKMEASITRFAI
jgi:chromosome segregation ATPase